MTPTTPLPTDAELKDLIMRLRDPEFFSRYGKREDLLETASLLERLSPQVGEDVVERAKVLEAIGDPGKAPCGCESCYCGNFDDAAREGAWREQKATYDKIVELPAARLLSSPREDETPIAWLVSSDSGRSASFVTMNEDHADTHVARYGCTSTPLYAHLTPSRGDETLRLGKKPVAFRVKDLADDWILFHDEEAANREAEHTGAIMQGLYVRDGSPLASTPSSPAGDAEP